MVLRFFILLVTLLLCASGCNSDGVSEDSMVMHIAQEGLAKFDGVEVLAMIGDVILDRDNKVYFFSPQIGFIPTNHSAKKIYNLYSRSNYLLIDLNGRLHILEFAEEGICNTKSILQNLTFESASVSLRDGAVHVFAIETTGNVWKIGQLLFGDIEAESVEGLQHITEVADSILSVALDMDGSLWSWGLDFAKTPKYDEYAGTLVKIPSIVTGLPKIKKIAGSQNTLFALADNGELWIKGVDFGLLDTSADRYKAENAGPGQIWYYPLFEWTKAASSIQDMYWVSSDCLCIISDSDVVYYGNNAVGPRPSLLEERPDGNSAIISSRQDSETGCFFSYEQLPSNARMFYDSEQITCTIKEATWLDYWANRSSQIILRMDGRIECFKDEHNVQVTLDVNDAERLQLHINEYAIPQSFFISYGDRLWVIPFP